MWTFQKLAVNFPKQKKRNETFFFLRPHTQNDITSKLTCCVALDSSCVEAMQFSEITKWNALDALKVKFSRPFVLYIGRMVRVRMIPNNYHCLNTILPINVYHTLVCYPYVCVRCCTLIDRRNRRKNKVEHKHFSITLIVSFSLCLHFNCDALFHSSHLTHAHTLKIISVCDSLSS